jgi:hypothetical protein
MLKFDIESDFNNSEPTEVPEYLKKDFPHRRKRGDYWYTIDIDELVIFGYPVFSFWDNSRFYNSMYWRFSGSENIYVKLLCSLVKLGAVKKRQIKYISYGKRDYNEYNLKVNDIIESSEISFTVMEYGYNNSVSITLNIMYFLKLDFSLFYGLDYYQNLFKTLTKQNTKLFPEKLFKNQLTPIELNYIAIEFLNHKINLKQKRLCNQ